MPENQIKKLGDAKLAGDEFSRSVRHIENLGALLAELDAFLSRKSVAAPLLHRARLVVEELVTNAFSHGGAASAGGVVVQLRGDAASPAGSVSYAGPAFDPTAAWTEDGDECRVGGRGLPLIQNLTGRLRYSREGETNRVEFEISARNNG